MTRLPDWEARLSAFVARHTDRPFEWGTWDCALMATAAAEAMTGEDRAADFRGRYSDRVGSAKALREIGAGTLHKTMDSLFDPRPVTMARRGDLVGMGSAIGVCLGRHAIFVGEEDGEAGFVTVPRALWEHAWTV